MRSYVVNLTSIPVLHHSTYQETDYNLSVEIQGKLMYLYLSKRYSRYQALNNVDVHYRPTF